MITRIKNIESFLRQYGIEGEDAFLVLTSFYLRIYNPLDTSKNLEAHRKKGENLLSKFTNDLVLIDQLKDFVISDDSGKSLPIAYQYFHSKKFRDNTGKFFTPKEVAEAMVNMLPIKKEAIVFDPTCGGGTFLLSALKRWGNNPVEIIGNDIDKTLVYLTELLLIINNSNKKNKFNFVTSNLYTEISNFENYFNKIDYILANPPFSIKIDSLSCNSPLFNIGYRNSDALFIDLCYELLKTNGKLVCLLPHSLVANKEFSKFRKEIEKHWIIKGVFVLPEGVFNTTSNTTTRADIIVLNKGKSKSTNKIVFGNISKVGVPTTQRQKLPVENELKEILKLNNIVNALN